MQEMRTAVRLLTADEVCGTLDVDRSTVYRMAGDGRLPAIKVGRQWRFPAAEVEALLSTAGAGLPTPTGAVVDTSTDAVTGRTAEEPQSPPSGLHRLPAGVAQAVLDAVAEPLGVMMVVADMQGRPVTRVANPCPWFAARADDPAVLATCTAEWRELADELDLAPRFSVGALGFSCARAFIRDGDRLIGMVLAGGVAPDGAPAWEGLYRLDADARGRVLRALPRLAATLARLAGEPTPATGSEGGDRP